MRLLVSKVALHSTHRNTKNKTKKNTLTTVKKEFFKACPTEPLSCIYLHNFTCIIYIYMYNTFATIIHTQLSAPITGC